MFEKLKSMFGGKTKVSDINKRLSKKLHNMHFKYISEKLDDENEIIIGRDGHLNLEGENSEILCATSGIDTLFRLNIAEMKIWEFMSLNGCVITFTDIDTGKVRNVSVYYDAHLVRT